MMVKASVVEDEEEKENKDLTLNLVRRIDKKVDKSEMKEEWSIYKT